MLTINSPFLNIPVQLDRKQAVFLDGICHAVQISNLSYTRLCKSLTSISELPDCNDFSHVFLDAWAFIDAADRFRFLWQQQPKPLLFAQNRQDDLVLSSLQNIRNVRNVAAHIAQKIDQIVALNSSVLGEISWVTLLSEKPLRIKTHFIRPGVVFNGMNAQFSMPKGDINFANGSGAISIVAGKHTANLSEAYEALMRLVRSAEMTLVVYFHKFSNAQRLPANILGCAELDTGSI
jgi:hypothetical protein